MCAKVYACGREAAPNCCPERYRLARNSPLNDPLRVTVLTLRGRARRSIDSDRFPIPVFLLRLPRLELEFPKISSRFLVRFTRGYIVNHYRGLCGALSSNGFSSRDQVKGKGTKTCRALIVSQITRDARG